MPRSIPYDELRRELIAAWKQYEKRRKQQGKHPRGAEPTMPILDGRAQPGPDQKRCYGCGTMGHVRGDSKWGIQNWQFGKEPLKDLKGEWKVVR